MKEVLAIGLMILWGAPQLWGAAERASPEAPMKTSQVEPWIEQLADEDYASREKASAKLWEMGEVALPRLREAELSDNPEMAVRASELVDKIELGILPDSDPEVIELIRRHADANTTAKRKIYAALMSKRAWRQVLGLYARESDQVIRSTYAARVRFIVLSTAREALREGQPERAREVLVMAPADARNLLMLAEFHRNQGSLEAELERMKDRKGPKAAAWRLALYRAAGNLSAAQHEAQLANEPEVAAMLAAMSGNPIPWLERGLIEKEGTRSAKLYSGMAIDRWSGSEVDSEDLKKLRDMSQSNDLHSRNGSLNLLFLIGQTDIAEATLSVQSPIEAFWMLNALERVDDALAILGVDAHQLPDENWVGRLMQAVIKNEFLSGDQIDPIDKLATFAAFLESRGMIAEASKLLTPPAMVMATENQSVFLGFISKLSSSDPPSIYNATCIAANIGAHWAGESDEKWNLLIEALLQENNIAHDWWRWSSDLAPKASRKQRLDGLLALLRIGPDSGGQRRQWIKRAWVLYDEAAEKDKGALLQRLISLGRVSADSELSLRSADLAVGGKQAFGWDEHIIYLSVTNRWQETSKLLMAQMDGSQQISVQLHAYAAAALRQTGKEKLAMHHEVILEELWLGDAKVAYEIGNAYAFGFDFERARKWWWKAMLFCNPQLDSTSNGDTLIYKAALRCADSLMLDPKRWREAASMQEFVCSLLTNTSYQWESSNVFLVQRLKADLCRLLMMLEGDRDAAIRQLKAFHNMHLTNGVLADYFFPMLRQAGLIEEHDQWFAETWQALQPVIKQFPGAASTRNTAAWFASRAQRNLDEAESLLGEALGEFPYQDAYLDTMAEIHFARGDRASALEWSNKALRYAPNSTELRMQHHHFMHDKLPAKH